MYVAEVNAYRCYDCKRIVADVQFKNNFGKCPYCNSGRFSGAQPTTFEMIVLSIKLLFMKGYPLGRKYKKES